MVNPATSARRGLCAVLLALATALAHAHPDHAGAMHGHGGHPDAGLGASAAFDRHGTLWAVGTDGGYVVVRSSTDLGRSWSAPRHVDPSPEGVDTEGDARPRIAIGPQGELYVTWTRPLGKPYTGNIRFSRSIDGGRSFSAPSTINADRQEITHRFDSITVTPDGTIFVAWIDKRDSVAASRKKQAYAGAALYYATSTDRGASFGADHKLADHTCECCRIALLPTHDDRVLAFWRHVFPPNIRDHALAEIGVHGSGEMRRATFDDWRVDACPHHGPSLAADGAGRLQAVWFSGGENDAGVFYGRLGNGRVEGRQRVGGETAEHADIAASGSAVAIAWKEFDGVRSQLKAMVSEDGGVTWRQLRLATTDGPSDQPRMLQYDGRFYVLWNTSREPFSVHPVPR